jgi:hypothetical protein
VDHGAVVLYCFLQAREGLVELTIIEVGDTHIEQSPRLIRYKKKRFFIHFKGLVGILCITIGLG